MTRLLPTGRGEDRSRFAGSGTSSPDDLDQRPTLTLQPALHRALRATRPEADPDCTQALSRGLAGYLAAVAAAVGVPVEGTSYEVSDTATAYLALISRLPDRPGRDLMLLWSERGGWTMSVETQPIEAPVVLARLGGDLAPEPQAVARFVVDVLAGRTDDGLAAGRVSRPALAARLSPYIDES